MRENNFKWKFDCKFVDGTNGYFKKTKQGGLIRLKHMPIDPSGYAMLQHEIFHAVETSLSYFGFTLTDASCEAYAYLIGYLTEKVYEILKVKRH